MNADQHDDAPTVTSPPRHHRMPPLLLMSIAAIVSLLATFTTHADPTDEEQIQDTIEHAVLLMGEACLEDSHGQEAAYKSTIEPYWSAATPEGTELAEREERFRMLFATPDPTDLTEANATLAADVALDPTLYPPDRATAAAEYVMPTPHWDPSHSPLEERWREIDMCQTFYGLPGAQSVAFGVSEFTFHSIEIEGDDAHTTVDVSLWSERDSGASEPLRTQATLNWEFWLKREDGVWKIRRQFHPLVP